MNFKTKFAMIHFLKLYYNVFIIENKIDAREFRRTCVNLCYTTLEIALICVILERFPSSEMVLSEIRQVRGRYQASNNISMATIFP
jgi:hypothetical protein